jgi:hypothetical protein
MIWKKTNLQALEELLFAAKERAGLVACKDSGCSGQAIR